MNQETMKKALCEAHTELLRIILYFGGYMLLAQLRVLCLALGLYSTAQAVDRAVRELREAGILNRQTWVDRKSDLLLAKKYAYRFFSGRNSQELATPRRPTTMGPYIAQARKIDWLLRVMQHIELDSLNAIHSYLTRTGCTMFLHLPELSNYYTQHCEIFTAEGQGPYIEQTKRLEVLTAQRAAIARAEPIPPSDGYAPVTLELAHRRGVYIEHLFPEKKVVRFAIFPGLSARPKRIIDWVIDAHLWAQTLMPYYRTQFVIYTLSEAHRASLRASLTAPAGGRTTPYHQSRLVAAHIDGAVQMAVTNTDFLSRWCGNIHPTTVF